MIGKETKLVSEPRPKPHAASRVKARTCRCGQQLDICARPHCPRCGRTLHQS